MGEVFEFAAHRIRNVEMLGFEPDEYSKFKFGLASVGIKYGNELFRKFYSEFVELLEDYKVIRVYGSPFQALPTAAHTISESFVSQMVKVFGDRITVGKLTRITTYTVDYGNLTAEERMNLISDDTFKFEENVEPGDLLIFIDDIKITGTHEKVVRNTLNRRGISNNQVFLYHAILEDSSIDPSFENELNYHYVKGTDNLIELIREEAFRINTRFVKFLLGSGTVDFHRLSNELSDSLKREIILGAYQNGYSGLHEFEENLGRLVSSVQFSEVESLS